MSSTGRILGADRRRSLQRAGILGPHRRCQPRPESNLFFYYVTVTERKTQHVPEYLSGEDAFSKDYEETWTGVRGDLEDPVDDAGGAVSVYDPAVAAIGETLAIQWSKNQEDCTLNAQGRKEKAKANVDAGRSCSRTVFDETDVERVSGASQASDTPAPSGGAAYDYQSNSAPTGSTTPSNHRRKSCRWPNQPRRQR